MNTFTAQLHDPNNTDRAISATIRAGTGPDAASAASARAIAVVIADATGYVIADFYGTAGGRRCTVPLADLDFSS